MLAKNARNADALHLLGVIEREEGNAAAAERLIRRSIALKPSVPAAFHNLGSALQDLGRHAEAVAAFRHVAALKPGHAKALFSSAVSLRALGHHEEAHRASREAVRSDPGFAEAQAGLAISALAIGRIEEAVAAARTAAQLSPGDARFADVLGDALKRDGRTQSARRAYGRALRARHRWLRPLWSRLHTLPPIYTSDDRLEACRHRWARDLDEFVAALDLDTDEGRTEAYAAIGRETNFFLHYQGRDDRALQERYAATVASIARAALPAFAEPRAPKTGTRALRVGFVSAYFRHHSIMKTHGRYASGLTAAGFETYVYHLGVIRDDATRALEATCTRFRHIPGTAAEAAAVIAGDDLDALIYPDIGMDPKVQILAALHLAPLQMTALGHPVTSGFDSIHLFLSSELMEPPEADSHYSEELVRLPNLGVNYAKPPTTDPTEGENGGRGHPDAPTFLCAQSLFKLLPVVDELCVRLAREIGRCRFWFIGAAGEAFARAFRERIAAAFSSAGLDAANYVHVFPRLSQAEFYAVNRAADVGLDAFGWSGFNSTMEATACGLPVVTAPGRTLRARHTAACHRRIGLDDLVAPDLEAYVGRAASLASSRELRRAVAAELDARHARLFDDAEPVEALAHLIRERWSG